MKAPGLRWLAPLLLGAFALWVLLPLVWVALGSLKPGEALFSDPFGMPDFSDPAFENYGRAWTEARLGSHFLDSLLLTLATAGVVTLLGAGAAHGLARFRTWATEPLFWLFLFGLVVPAQLAALPLFFMMRDTGLLGTRTGLFLVYVANGLPFAVFVLTPFFRQMPRALEEAALIDGCTRAQVFWRILLPLARPGLATVAIFQAIGVWKEYFFAFLLLSTGAPDAVQTLPLALGNLAIAAQYRSDYGLLFAGIILVTLPILVIYLVLQKQIVAGLQSGAVKG